MMASRSIVPQQTTGTTSIEIDPRCSKNLLISCYVLGCESIFNLLRLILIIESKRCELCFVYEGDVVVIVEDDDKNAAKGRNRQVLRDIGNVVRRNHPKNNDPAKTNHPRTRSQHAPLVEVTHLKVCSFLCRSDNNSSC